MKTIFDKLIENMANRIMGPFELNMTDINSDICDL